jgi:uncharacterized protein YdeI (BOF family)
MKNILLTTFLLLFLALTGCSGEKYGSGVDPDAPKVQVQDVFLKQELFGKKVTLEGKIVSQCQSNGCWFYLQDETGQIYIDLAKSQLTLPSRPGKQVLASGTVGRTKQSYLLVASGVEVK